MTAGIQIICIIAAEISVMIILDGIVKFRDTRRRIRQRLQCIRDDENRQNPPWEI